MSALTSPSAVDIYLVRHGTTHWNLEGKWQGETDTELAPQGVAEAEAEGATFSDLGVTFDAAYCSDLKRAHHTAELLCSAACGTPGMTPVPARALRECSLGAFEGMHKGDIFDQYAHVFEKLQSLPAQERVQTSYFDGLETPADISRRVVDFIKGVVAPAHAGQSVLLVTHSVILESVLAVLDGKAFDGISMRRLAWIHATIDGDELTIKHLDGFTFEDGLCVTK
jgi:broad specificity phosphatase PhoE